ncbi:hypothetical protein WJX84_002970 [Apatococcus fuscideae]|uniref:Uncharacterized protein n=1 Tax=Apatococcus fuscideae TaxID=2026836 RepID=A0AAW1TE25_9CHLO
MSFLILQDGPLGDRVTRDSKLEFEYSPSLQPKNDPVKKAVQSLAKNELLSFGAAVRSRICLGHPNKPQKEGEEQVDGFAQKVDRHFKKFLPYLQQTGVTAEDFKKASTDSYRSLNEGTHPIDKQLQDMAEACCDYVELMQDSMPHECQLATHFAWIKAHLFALHG